MNSAVQEQIDYWNGVLRDITNQISSKVYWRDIHKKELQSLETMKSNLENELKKLEEKKKEYNNMNKNIEKASEQVKQANGSNGLGAIVGGIGIGYSSQIADKKYNNLKEYNTSISKIQTKIQNILTSSNNKINEINKKIEEKTKEHKSKIDLITAKNAQIDTLNNEIRNLRYAQTNANNEISYWYSISYL